MCKDKNFSIEPVYVKDVLDLHGFYPEQIPEVLQAFIENAISLKLPEIRIIHGKGKSRLKYEVHSFLKECDQILSFHDAPPQAGGWGATIAYIKL